MSVILPVRNQFAFWPRPRSSHHPPYQLDISLWLEDWHCSAHVTHDTSHHQIRHANASLNRLSCILIALLVLHCVKLKSWTTARTLWIGTLDKNSRQQNAMYWKEPLVSTPFLHSCFPSLQQSTVDYISTIPYELGNYLCRFLVDVSDITLVNVLIL